MKDPLNLPKLTPKSEIFGGPEKGDLVAGGDACVPGQRSNCKILQEADIQKQTHADA